MDQPASQKQQGRASGRLARMVGFTLAALLSNASFARADAPSPQHSSPRDQAKAAEAAGVAAFRAGSYDAAIRAFREADRLSPSPALSFNVAKAYDHMGDIGQSLFWYSDYLRRSPEASDASEVRRLIADRESTLATRGTQLLVVRSRPSGATVEVDDQAVCTTPCAAVVSPGAHQLVLSRHGYEATPLNVVVSHSRMNELHLELKATSESTLLPEAPPPLGAAEPRRAPTSQGDGSPLSVAPAAALVRGEPNPEKDEAPPSWVTVGLLGAGITAFATAGVFEVLRRDAKSEAESASQQLEKQSALERMDRDVTVARIAGVAGALLSVSAGVLWWWEAEQTHDLPQVSVSSTSEMLTVNVSGRM